MDDKLSTAKAEPHQFPGPCRMVYVFKNGDTKGHPHVGIVTRAFTKGAVDSVVNVALFSPEGNSEGGMTSVQHHSQAPKGAPCWTWPS